MRTVTEKKVDMLHGSLWDKILLFAMPVAFSSIVQQLFNAADIAVVGRYAGTSAMAAVGSNSSTISLIVNLFVGLSVGTNVVISNCIGKGDGERTRRALHTSIGVALISGLFLLVFGQLVIRPLLLVMAVPEDVFEQAVLYLRIYFLGMPFTMVYNFGSAALRSKGDTQRPMVILTCAGVVNILLNLLFVCVCKLGVAGVAIATVISQIVSAGWLMLLLVRETGEFRFNIREMHIDWGILKDMARIGIPSGLQGCVFSLSNVCIQSAINGLGTISMAACTAVINYELFTVYVINSFSQACVTFTSQNLGAGNMKRCNRVFYTSIGLATLFMCVISTVMVLFGRPLIRVFNNQPEVVELGMIRILYIMPFELLNMTIDVVSGALRGLGHSFVPTAISLGGICGVRLTWVYTVFQTQKTLGCLMVAYPLSWTVTTVVILVAYFLVRKRMTEKIGISFSVQN